LPLIASGLDIKGKPLQLTLDGFAARVFQHEVDHLDGILFTDYIDDPTKLAYYPPPAHET